VTKKTDFFIKLRDQLLDSCGKCDHSGFISFPGVRCDCLTQYETYIELDDAGINREYWDLTFKDWKGDLVAKKRVVEYIDNIDSAYENGLGLVLHGSYGTGKTMLSSLILTAALKKEHTIRFITMAEVCDKMRSKIDNVEDNSFYEDKVKNVDFLCLDNLGSEYHPTKFGTYILSTFDILARYRRRNFLPTILTTNLSKSDFIDLYGSAISSLFSACSQFVQVEGKNYRDEQNKQFESKLKKKS